MNVVSFLFLNFFLFFLKPQSSHFRASPLSLICLRTQQILEIGTIWSALSRAPSPLLFPLAPEWRALVLSHNCWCLVILAEGGTQLPTSPPQWFLSSGCGAPGCEAALPSLTPVKVLPGLQLQGWCGDAPGPQAVLICSLPQSPVLPPADDHGPDL